MTSRITNIVQSMLPPFPFRGESEIACAIAGPIVQIKCNQCIRVRRCCECPDLRHTATTSNRVALREQLALSSVSSLAESQSKRSPTIPIQSLWTLAVARCVQFPGWNFENLEVQHVHQRRRDQKLRWRKSLESRIDDCQWR